MAITSVGYDGIVNEIQWATMIEKLGSSEYGVLGVDDFKVSGVAGVDRTVSIAPGKAWGHGVYDTSTSEVTVQLDTVGSGFRWDMIAIRRDWTGSGGATTVVSVNGTTAPIIPPGRTTGPGVVDEQPIALVQVTAGVASPTAYIDLRVWAGNGGVIADNWLALTYLDSLGTSLYTNNDGKRYTRTIGQDGNPLWIASVPDAYTPLWGVGQTLSGGIPAVSEGHPPAFLIQAGTYVTHFDDAGYARIIFPRPFPNGLLYVSGFNGDDYATGGSMTFASAGHVWGAEGYGTPASWVYTGRAQDASDDGAGSLLYNRNWCRGRIHRINWLAIGW